MSSRGENRNDAITLETFRKNGFPRVGARPFGRIPKRRSYLIVCEGEKTEPNYFRALSKCLPRNMVENVVVEGVGGTPDYLLQFAKEKIDERMRKGQPPFYYVWLVFDRDDFRHFSDTISAVDALNRKRESMPPRCRALEHWDCAWSNEAFEIWYLLHFREELGGAVSRTRYCEMLTREIRNYTGNGDYEYRKNDPGTFRLLSPNTVSAIERAKRCLAHQIAEHGMVASMMNPATRVHLLVESLLSYLQKGN